MGKWCIGIGIAVITVALLAACAALYLTTSHRHYLADRLELTEPVLYIVNPGEGMATILDRWHTLGYVDAVPPLLMRHLRFQQRPLSVKLGHYQLQPKMTVDEAMTILTKGKTVAYRWQIIEGSTLIPILESLRTTKHVRYDLPIVTSRADYAALAKALGLKRLNPEGLFFADSYNFLANSTASALLKRSMRTMTDVLEQEWQGRAQDVPYKSAYDALIMASIIEKETGLASERQRIAGVFSSRLRKGMRLQTDPTVIYGVGDAYDGNITRADLRRKTPYNTYVIRELPPTPIASVGREAIHAALHPIEDGSLYFVARGDGSHAFSATFVEHKKAVARFQLRRRKDYRSKPK